MRNHTLLFSPFERRAHVSYPFKIQKDHKLVCIDAVANNDPSLKFTENGDFTMANNNIYRISDMIDINGTFKIDEPFYIWKIYKWNEEINLSDLKFKIKVKINKKIGKAQYFDYFINVNNKYEL